MTNFSVLQQSARKLIETETARNDTFFLYDAKALQTNALCLRDSWSALNRDKFKIFYSLKANPNLHILRLLSNLVDGFDVSSSIELDKIKQLGISGDRITASGPAKTDEFIKNALAHQILAFHIDSLEEYQRIHQLNHNHQKLRLNLRLNAAGSAKLGFDFKSLQTFLSTFPSQKFSGLHVYTGRESFNEEKTIELVQRIGELRRKYNESWSSDFAFYFGPGIPSTLMESGSIWSKSPGEKAEFPVHLECGRALVGNAGCYVAPVLSVKSPEGQRRLAIINGGIQHISASFLSPSIGDKALRYAILNRAPKTPNVPTAVYGSLCLSNDVLHPELLLPADLQREDWLIFYPCGAYGPSASPNQFIGSPPAQEYIMNSSLAESGQLEVKKI